MITLLVEENNPITQNFYDKLFFSLQIHRIRCSCGHSGCLSVHAYYYRSVKTGSKKISLRIGRLRCSQCSRTHAVLLSSLVPYSQIKLKDHISIISNYESRDPQENVMNSTPSIDESNYRYIILCYKNHWQEKLRSEHIKLTPMIDLVSACFSRFSYQFMQIKSTPNVLFPLTT